MPLLKIVNRPLAYQSKDFKSAKKTFLSHTPLLASSPIPLPKIACQQTNDDYNISAKKEKYCCKI